MEISVRATEVVSMLSAERRATLSARIACPAGMLVGLRFVGGSTRGHIHGWWGPLEVSHHGHWARAARSRRGITIVVVVAAAVGVVDWTRL